MTTYTLYEKGVERFSFMSISNIFQLTLKCAHFRSKYANKHITLDRTCKLRKCFTELLYLTA